MDLQNFLFLDESDTGGVSNTLNCTGAKQLTLSVEADAGASVNLEVQGSVDFESDEWFALGAISLVDYEPYEAIEDTGIYAFVIDGIGRVRVQNNGTAGNCVVFGRITG